MTLALCLVACSSKRDHRQLVILIAANATSALRFVCVGRWVASMIARRT